MESRAAVFTSAPQSVEVYQAGTWWRGELLGWRHDPSGTCQMWVRVVVGGVEETAWIDLAALRLPERQPAPAAEPSRIDSRVRQELPPARAASALRGRAAGGDAATTTALPMIRDEVRAPAAISRAAGSTSATPGSRTGGRRRAPEDADVQVVVAAEVPVPAGRHRAPGDEGRHRAADTSVFAAVADEAGAIGAGAITARPAAVVATGSRPAAEPRRASRPHAGAGRAIPSARTARPEESFTRPEVCTGRIDAQPDLLTRPMRLGDLGPNAGSPHPQRGSTLSDV